MSASMREAQAQDWLDDLREFGAGIVSEACRQWRRQPGGKRPTPGDIRALCIREQREERERHELEQYRRRLPPPKPDDPHQDELAAAGRDMTDRWARLKGYRDFDDYLASGGTYADAWDDIKLNGIST